MALIKENLSTLLEFLIFYFNIGLIILMFVEKYFYIHPPKIKLAEIESHFITGCMINKITGQFN